MAKGLDTGGMKKGSLKVEKSQLFCSITQSYLTVCDPMDCSTPGFPILPYTLLKLMSVESVRPSNHLILCHLFLLPSVFPSIMVFSSESALHIKWLEYWSFSFSINPSNEYSGLISSRIDLFYFLAIQGTLKNLLQQHNSKASIFRHSALFMVQLSYTSAKYQCGWLYSSDYNETLH